MRNKLSDIEYAIGKDGKGGNNAFRITFLGYTDRNITKIDFEKNAFKRNENDKITSVRYNRILIYSFVT